MHVLDGWMDESEATTFGTCANAPTDFKFDRLQHPGSPEGFACDVTSSAVPLIIAFCSSASEIAIPSFHPADIHLVAKSYDRYVTLQNRYGGK